MVNIQTICPRRSVLKLKGTGHRNFLTADKKAKSIISKTKLEDGCFVWTGATDKDGYGVTSWRINSKKQWRIPRLAWFLFVGGVKSNRLICHHCDNRRCWNPDHLYEGTPKNNSDDIDRRGRRVISRGENQGGSKLTSKQVLEMRRLHSVDPVKYSCHKLAPMFGIKFQNAWCVVARKTWRHLP